MNADMPLPPRDELESKLTALILGELPPDEAFKLGRALEQDQELVKLYDRLKQTTQLVREVAATDVQPVTHSAEPERLSDAKREQLMAKFKTVTPKQFVKPRRIKFGIIEMAAMFSLMAVLAALLLPALSKAKYRGQRFSANSAAADQRSRFSFGDGFPAPASTNSPVMTQIDSLDAGRALTGQIVRDMPPAEAQNKLRTQREARQEFGIAQTKTDSLLTPDTGLPTASTSPSGTVAQNRTAIALPSAIASDDLTAANKPAQIALGLHESEKLLLSSDGTTKGVGASGGGGGAGGISGVPQQIEAGKNLAWFDSEHQKQGTVALNDESLRHGGQDKFQLDLSEATRAKVAASGNRDDGIDPTSGRPIPTDALAVPRINLTGVTGTSPDLHTFLQTPLPSSDVNGPLDPATGLPIAVASPAPPAPVAMPPIAATAAEPVGRVEKELVTPQKKSEVYLGAKLQPTPPTAGAPAVANESLGTFPAAAVTAGTFAANGFVSQQGKDAKQVPILGDMPALGNLGRAESPLSQSNDLAKKVPTRGAVNSFGDAGGLTVTNGIALPDTTASFGGYAVTSGNWALMPKERAKDVLQDDDEQRVLRQRMPDADQSGKPYDPNTRYRGLSQSSAEPAAKALTKESRGDRKKQGQTGAGSNLYDLNIVGYSTNQVTPEIAAAQKRFYRQPSQSGQTTSHPLETPKGGETSSRSQETAPTYAYSEAKRKLEEARKVEQILALKLTSEKVEPSLPKTSMVEIMDTAQPGSDKEPSLFSRLPIIGSGTVSRSARIKIDRDQSDVSAPTTAEAGQATGYDPYFFQTESETIRSDRVLGKVVHDLNLQNAWADKSGKKVTEKAAIERLRKCLEVRPVRNTSMFEIGAKAENGTEAANIANAVAKTYLDFRHEQRREVALSGVAGLEAARAKNQKRIEVAQAEVDRLSKPAAIPDEDTAPKRTPSTTAPIPQPEILAAENPFSTFSLNVSDVSFKLAAASLEKGLVPDAATIRSEEFLNAFDYRDPEPAPGMRVAFAWERARDPFAQGRDLLRFSVKTAAEGRQAGRPMNLVLLLDNSGSMERADRVAIIREALKVLATQLHPEDKFSVVTFARTARLWVDGIAGNDAGKVADSLSELTPQGGTNLEEAMRLAYETALRHYLPAGINRVVLLTDGAANLGDVSPDSLKQKVEANRKQGIALDCFGIGWEGYNDDLLEVLSRNGDGRYGFINSPEEAATEFAGQLAGALHVAASDVKVQVEFNTNRVTVYRQIGYAKHQLTKEQFRDNTVDAAEIGAAESGNALYVVAVNPAGEGPLATVRVRYKVPGTSDYHEHEWAVPYSGNAAALEQSTPAMRLAATSASFAEWLVVSPHASEVTPNALLGYLSGVPDVYGADTRPKKLEWMIRQAKSMLGK